MENQIKERKTCEIYITQINIDYEKQYIDLHCFYLEKHI
jgi:hypothetical protein